MEVLGKNLDICGEQLRHVRPQSTVRTWRDLYQNSHVDGGFRRGQECTITKKNRLPAYGSRAPTTLKDAYSTSTGLRAEAYSASVSAVFLAYNQYRDHLYTSLNMVIGLCAKSNQVIVLRASLGGENEGAL